MKSAIDLSIIKSKSLIPFSTFSEADKEKLLYRADLSDQKTEVQTVCVHHKALMIDNHEALQKYCCNPFKTHKNNTKQNLQIISVKFAKDLQKNQFAIIPGRKVCGNCKSKLNKLCEGISSSSSDTDFTRHSTDGEENTCVGQMSSCQLNTSKLLNLLSSCTACHNTVDLITENENFLQLAEK